MPDLEKYKNSPEKLEKLLKSKAVDIKDKYFLYSLLVDENISDKIRFLVWKVIKAKPELFDIEELSKLLQISEMNVKKIFKSPPIEVKFPIALNGKADIATAYIIRLPKPSKRLSLSNDKEKTEALNTIKEILEKRNFENKNFFVIFDKDFVGKSFMLSVIAGLVIPEENLENLAFTGVLNEEGEILEVIYIPDKEKISQEKGLTLIKPDVDILDNIDELIYWLGDEPIDIPFLFFVKREKNEVLSSLRKIEKKIKQKKPFFSLKGLKQIFNINLEDLFISYDNWLSPLKESQIFEDNEWIHQVKNFEEKLKNLYSKISKKSRILHLGFSIPASLAMALGIKLGAKKPVVLYHYQADEYMPVIDLSDKNKLRKIKYIRKNIKQHLKNVEVEYTSDFKNTKNVAVSIWLASHSPYGDVKNYLKANNKNWDMIKIESKDFQGDIPLPGDFEYADKDYWTRYISEIYSVLNVIKNKHQIQNYHFFLSVPLPIAFALGMAIGHFWDGYIYNFSQISSNLKEKYYPVFYMKDNNIKSIF